MMKKEVGSRDFERAQRADDSSQVRTLPVEPLLPSRGSRVRVPSPAPTPLTKKRPGRRRRRTARSRRTIQGYRRQACPFAERERIAVRRRLRARSLNAPSRIIRTRWGTSGILQGMHRLTGGLVARRLSALSGLKSTWSAGESGPRRPTDWALW